MQFSKLSKVKNILIYGYGVEGKSTENFLKSHFPEIKINIYDDFLSMSGLKNKAFQKKSELCFSDYNVIICSPGIPRSKITGVDKQKITSQTEIFFANLTEKKQKKIIGITGTKGKSTTTQFCKDLLTNAGKTVKIAGNFGVPPLELFDELQSGALDFIVFEMSSFQLEYLQKSPHIALFLNLFGDHLDRHGTMEKYFLAKSNIFRYQRKEDFLVVSKVSGKLLEFSRGNGRFILSQKLKKEVFPENSVFRALHFRQNLGTIKTLCDILKIPFEILEKTAKEFKGLEHRMELFVEKNGIRFVDDAIAVNPTATMAAVRFFKKDLGSIILGGTPSGDTWEELLKLIRDETDSFVLLFKGDSLSDILQATKNVQFPAERIVQTNSFEDVVFLAKKQTPQGKICLLSPGAKSFDCFKNYGEKGNAFKQLILHGKN